MESDEPPPLTAEGYAHFNRSGDVGVMGRGQRA
jgi:hypothetical protein